MVLSNNDSPSSVRDLYKSSHILPISGLFGFYRAQLMFDILNNVAPDCLHNIFCYVSERHQYGTRNTGMIQRPRKPSTRSGFSLRHQLPLTWERLPGEILDQTVRLDFRRLLRGHCAGCYDFD